MKRNYKIKEKEPNSLLASKKDKEIFFDALMNSNKPNNNLKEAAKRYKEVSTK